MAETIRGINVQIGAETTGLSKALSDVNKKSRDIQSELRQVEKLLKFDPGNTDLLAQKQKLLSEAIINTAKRLDTLRDAQKQVEDQFARGEISEGQYRAFQREVVQAEQELKRIDGQLDETTRSLKEQGVTVSKLGKEYQDAFDQAKQAAGNAFDQMKQVGAGITAAGAGMAVGLGSAIKTSMEFEAQLSRVGAIADATGPQLEALRQSALDLGASTSKSASEVAKGQEELAALGFTVDEILGAMPGVISAAEASGADMAQTAEVMASTLNIFGKEASEAAKVADILAKTANVSAADITDMQYALKYAGPPAAALGVSLEELSAAIGIMTNAGMKGEQAGTTLRAALLSLLDPSEENSKMMETMGIQVTDLEGNFVGLEQLVKNLDDSMEGFTDTQKAAALSSLVGTEAVSGMLSLMAAGPSEINKFTKALENSGGASAEAAAKMKDNLKGAIDEMSGAFETLMITIGTALTPAVQGIANALGGLANWFNSLSPSMQNFAAIAAAVAASLALLGGPLLMLVGFLPQISAGFSMLQPVLAALTGPIGIVIASVAALAAGLTYLYNNNETVRNGLNTAWEFLKTTAINIFNGIKSFWDKWGADIVAFFKNNWEITKNVFKTVFDTISQIVKRVFDGLEEFWDKWGSTITETFKNILEILKIAFKAAFEVIFAVVKTIFNGIKAFWSTWGTTIKGLFTTTLNVVKTLFQGTWNSIKIIIETAIGVISGVVKAFLAVLKGDWKGAWDAVKGIAESVWNGIKNMFSNVGSTMRTIGKDIMQGLINGIKDMANAVWESAKDVAAKIKNGFKDFFGIKSPSRLMMGYGEYISEGLAIGIEDAGKLAVKAAEDVAKGTSDGIRKTLQINSPSKVTTKLGEETGEGLSEGIKKKKKSVKKSAEDLAKAAFEASKKYIDERKYYNELSLEQELKVWQKLSQKYKAGSEQRRQADREVYRLKQELIKAEQDAEKKAFDQSKTWIESKRELNKLSLSEELAAWERLTARQKEGSAERAEAEKQVMRVRQSIYTELKAASDDYLAKVKQVNESVAAEEQRLNDVYQQAVENRAKSIYSFAGLFDEVAEKAEVSGKQLMDNLKGQVETMTEWADTLNRLGKRGLDDGLMSELREMGPRAAAEIMALNSMTDSELTEFQELWRTKNQMARTQAVRELEGLRVDTLQQIRYLNVKAAAELDVLQKEFTDRVKKIRSGTKNEFNAMTSTMPEIGREIVNGLMAGIDEMAGPLKNKVAQLSKSISNTIKNTLKIKSPSRVTMGLGEFVSEGLAVGIANAQGLAVQSAKNLTGAVSKAMNVDPVGISAAASSAMGGSAGTGSTVNNINMNGMFNGAVFHVRSDDDIKKLSQELGSVITGSARGLGGVAR